MEATFNNSVKVLVKAFLNGTLQKQNCMACAVGNLVAAAKGCVYSVIENGIVHTANIGDWYSSGVMNQCRNRADHKELVEIAVTGYTFEQVVDIEAAFEGNGKNDDSMESQYEGLMAVVDVLATIHNVDLQQAETAKLLFVKA